MGLQILIKDGMELNQNISLSPNVILSIPEIDYKRVWTKNSTDCIRNLLHSLNDEKIEDLLKLAFPFHLVVDDPSDTDLNQEEEPISFTVECSECHKECKTNMRITEIPFFGEIIIMATVCEHCGYKSSEVKSGGGVRDKGIKFTLRLTDPSDLGRELLKSEHSKLEIPALGLILEPGTLGGRLTTVEGLLTDIRDQLINSDPIISAAVPHKDLSSFLNKLDDCLNGKKFPFTLILDDPSGLSYLQNVFAPEKDPELEIEHYERSDEQNDELGIKDMVV